MGCLQHPITILLSLILAIVLFSFYDDIIGTIIVRNDTPKTQSRTSVHKYDDTCQCLNGSCTESAQCPNIVSELTLQYNTITWELNQDDKTYSTFLDSLRHELSGGGVKVCGKPVTPKSPTKKYVLVEIKPDSQQIMTLAIRISDVYFVGYQDKFNDAYRANFVKDEFEALKGSDLFKDAKIRSELPYKSNYIDLASVAKISRENLFLGIKDLKAIIEIVYGRDYKSKSKPKDIGRDLARFALISIQMISESTRFTYIENQVKSFGIGRSFTPDTNFILLENNWDTISKVVHNSAPACKPVKIDKLPWDDIKVQVSLLKFKGDK